MGPAGVAGLEAASLVIGFLTQTYLMRTLGAAGYGQCVLAVAISLGLGTLTDFGFNYAATRQAVHWAEDPIARHRLYWSVIATKVCIGTSALFIVALLPQATDLLPATATAIAGAIAFPTWYLLARHLLLQMAGALLAARAAMLLMITVFVAGPADVVIASVLNCAAPLAALVLVMGHRELRPMLRPRRVHRAEIAETFRLGLSTAWITTMPALGSALVQTLIGTLGSHATLGQYAAADKIRAGIQGLFTALGQALFPIIVARQRAGTSAARLPTLLLAMATIAALPLTMIPKVMVTFVAGEGFGEAAEALRVMSLAVIGSTAATAFGTLGLVARQQDAAFARAVTVGLLVQAGGLVALVPAFGAVGAAWALVIASAATLLAMAPALRRP